MTDVTMSRSGRIFFYVVIALVLVAGAVLIGRFWQIIATALVTSIITRPVYLRYLQWLKGRQGLAVGLTIVTVFLAVLVPAWIIITMTIGQAIAFAADISLWLQTQGSAQGGLIERSNELLASIPGLSEFQITGTALAQGLLSLVLAIAGWLANQVASVGGSIAVLIMRAVLFLTVLSTLLPGWPGLIRFLERLSPLPDRFNQIYVERFEKATRGMAWAGFVSIAAQAATMTFFLWLGGVRYLIFWFLVCVVLSVLPTGCSLVAFPVGGFLLLTGNTSQGLVIILGYILVTANVSPVVVPMVTGKQTQVNPALTALSLFGGVLTFGLIGVLYGPLIMVLIMTTLGIYLDYVKPGNNTPMLPEEQSGD